MNYKTPPCLLWISSNELKNSPLPHHLNEVFVVKFKIKWLPASSLLTKLSFASDLMFWFFLRYAYGGTTIPFTTTYLVHYSQRIV